MTNRTNRTMARRRAARYFASGVLAASVALTVATNVSAQAADALGGVPVIGAFTRLVTFRDYADERENTEAKIETPHVEGLGDEALERELNSRFDQYADALIAQYEADVRELGTEGHTGVTSTYEVLVDNDSQLTVALRTTLTQASSTQIDTFYTVDKRTGKILALSDLFRPGVDYIAPISAAVREQMESEMRADEEKVYFIREDDPEPFVSIAADQKFYVDADGTLVIAFDEYEVAPGYMGAVTFKIPTASLSGLLADGSLIR